MTDSSGAQQYGNIVLAHRSGTVIKQHASALSQDYKHMRIRAC